MARVLLTGITGYIGSHLARRLLEEGHEVYGLVRKPLNGVYLSGMGDKLHECWYDGSFTSIQEAVRQSRPEIVYHLAAYYTGAHGEAETPRLIASNITLGGGLLEAMALCGVGRLVYTTTVMCHYCGAVYRPFNLYAATKRAFSDLLSYYTDAGLLRAASVVLSDTYGPGDLRPKVLNLVKKAMIEKTGMALTDGEQDFDVVYIDDVVSGLIAAGRTLEQEGPASQTFQLGAGEIHTLRETVELLTEVTGQSLQAEWGARPEAPRSQKRAVRLYPPPPGWSPEVPLNKGLRRFWVENETERTSPATYLG